VSAPAGPLTTSTERAHERFFETVDRRDRHIATSCFSDKLLAFPVREFVGRGKKI
jgi:hypothetical protein